FNLCFFCENDRARLARSNNPFDLRSMNQNNPVNLRNNQETKNDLLRVENKIDRLQEQITQLIELQKEDQKRIKNLENELEIERKHSKDIDSWYRRMLDNMIGNEKGKS
ncbi:15400_t:CDS:1, partial [Racocetra persica]